MLVFLFAAAASVLTHELGHAIIQCLFGLPVYQISIGYGPRLFKIGVFEARILPLGGFVSPAGTLMTPSRWKGVLIAIGGVLSQWIVTFLIAFSHIYRWPSLNHFCCLYVLFSMLALLSLLPLKGRDGYYALQAITRKVSPNQITNREDLAKWKNSRF